MEFCDPEVRFLVSGLKTRPYNKKFKTPKLEIFLNGYVITVLG